MTPRRFALTSRVLLLSAALAIGGGARADVIGTGQAAGAPQEGPASSAPWTPERESLRQRIEALGVPSESAAERVQALDDEEVQALAGELDKLPAGGDVRLSNSEIIIILLGLILLALVL